MGPADGFVRLSGTFVHLRRRASRGAVINRYFKRGETLHICQFSPYWRPRDTLGVRVHAAWRGQRSREHKEP